MLSRKIIIEFALFLALMILSGKLVAQHAKCGTIVTPAQVAKEQAGAGFGLKQSLFAPNKCFGKKLSITVHIISDSLGNYGVTQGDILNSVQTLNSKFAPICISFEVCQFNYIENYKYDRFLKPAEEAELITLYSVPNTINIYYALTVSPSPGSTVGGYAYLPGGEDFIILSKSSLGSIVHEMGHFFGLYHTFETQFGSELVNESNCTAAGDLVCDTPADPGLGNTASPDCNLDPYIKDINNEWYVPHIGNTMSYYSSDCECGFTTGQYDRMANQYQLNRFYLW